MDICRLFEWVRQLNMSDLALENAIEAIVRNDPEERTRRPKRRKINRHRFKSIREDNLNAKFTMGELRLIAQLLKTSGVPGLFDAPLFDSKLNLLDELVRADRVTFVMGTRFFEPFETESVSRWDLDGQREIGLRIPQGTRDTTYVLTRGTDRPFPLAEWASRVERMSGQCRVVISNPVGCVAADFFLSDMFGVRPQQRANGDLPVMFVQDHDPETCRSSFMRQPKRREPRTVIVDGDRYESGREGANYGVVVGQRLPDDLCRFVVGGTSGPATYTAACCLANGEIHGRLPDYRGVQHEPIFVAVTRGLVNEDTVPGTFEHRHVIERAVAATMVLAQDGKSKAWVREPSAA